MSISSIQTGLDDCLVLEFDRRFDERGWFQRGFGKLEFEELGIEMDSVQANFAFSQLAGTVRGMHLQSAPNGEDKLFHCISGSVFDVAVDLRAGSRTFGKWFGTELKSSAPKALLIPKGFAHGYMTLEDNVMVSYFVSNSYHPESEIAISPVNKTLDISWPRAISVISDKDNSTDPEAPIPNSGY